MLDSIINEFDKALKVLTVDTPAQRTRPDVDIKDSLSLTSKERKNHSKFMRVNHSGEICAQALYRGQLLFNKNTKIQKQLEDAATEELDHLAWCQLRIRELNGRTSYLNPMLYIGSFAIGSIASIIDEKYNLGFLSETEKQVSSHLENHLSKISTKDKKTIAIIKQMKEEEEKHEASAKLMGAKELPSFINEAMKLTSKIMTESTFRI
ncbi:2-polyprenyl-3-methyl-6-methoxy-1,4-benzoquinone monooxygenase [Methylophilaceae bacterium]|jgi:ubiquinone biosynthesis monooxygenase Coq7|nr:2-polyprenyl-3-methyl-6-methoxy-1,4-benzoquinone monooxygenase [Methylophilaceae bacterium]|tara:strand:- start:2772 stop:3395 length:624 start_codon:yes stop_codon:yes gene_type:complete